LRAGGAHPRRVLPSPAVRRMRPPLAGEAGVPGAVEAVLAEVCRSRPHWHAPRTFTGTPRHSRPRHFHEKVRMSRGPRVSSLGPPTHAVPIFLESERVMGFEPTTFCLGSRHSAN